MKKHALALLVVSALAGCSGQFLTNYEASVSPAMSQAWTVSDVIVTVPETLTVSDANTLAPNADIVWHGDLPGDRRAQVAAILDEGITQGVSALSGPTPVVVAVVAQEFHAVTPAALARAPSAVHNISYTMQVFSRAGEPITQPELIDADLPALVGGEAIAAFQTGQTQKARITAHLARVTQGWLGIGPDPRRTFRTVGR